MLKQRWSIALLILTVLAGPEANAAIRNEVPILVYWSTGQGQTAPSAVEFDDQRRGEIPFTLENDHYRGMRFSEASWAFHDVSLLYSNQAAPLALRTQAGVQSVRIDITLPTVSSCKPAQVNSVRQVSENAPVRARLTAMLLARHLLELRTNICPPWAKRDLAEIYFAMSCSLAKGTSFFRVSDEAKDRYRQFARDRDVAEARIKSCDTQMYGIAAASLRNSAQELLEQGNFQNFAAMNADLRASAANPDWKAGLAVQGLDENTLKADWVKGLYTRQQSAMSKGDYGLAIETNEALKNLLTLPQFKGAFQSISLDSTRLDADHAYLDVRASQKAPQ